MQGFNALSAKAFSLEQAGPLKLRSALTASAADFKTIRSMTDSFATLKERQIDPASLAAALKVNAQVDQLTKAEQLMEQAYKTLSDPSSNDVERLRADEQRSQALTLRSELAAGLSTNQRKALEVINAHQQDAIALAQHAIFDSSATSVAGHVQEFAGADMKFRLGAQDNTSLIDWLKAE